MRYQGKITKWNDSKGFGFILPNGATEEIFLHISSFANSRSRPENSQLVTYEISKDELGRRRALNVQYVSVRSKKPQRGNREKLSALFVGFMLIFTIFVAERTFSGHLPPFFPLALTGVNLVTFLYYYVDKTAAVNNSWRTPENVLHMLSVAGGWIGAYAAQKLFRHKNKKTSFLITYKATVLINCLGIGLSSTPKAMAYLLG